MTPSRPRARWIAAILLALTLGPPGPAHAGEPLPLARLVQDACRLATIQDADARILGVLKDPEALQFRYSRDVYEAHATLGACYGRPGPIVPELARSQTRLWEVFVTRGGSGGSSNTLDRFAFDQLVRLHPASAFPDLVRRFGRFARIDGGPGHRDPPDQPHAAATFRHLLGQGVAGEAAIRAFEAMALMTGGGLGSPAARRVAPDETMEMLALLPSPDRYEAMRRVVYDVDFGLCGNPGTADRSCGFERPLAAFLGGAFRDLPADRATSLAVDVLLATSDSYDGPTNRDIVPVRLLATLVGAAPPAALVTLVRGLRHRVAPGRGDGHPFYGKPHAEQITAMIGAARRAGWPAEDLAALRDALEGPPPPVDPDRPTAAPEDGFVRSHAGFRLRKALTDREAEGEFGLDYRGIFHECGYPYDLFEVKVWRAGKWVVIARVRADISRRHIHEMRFTLGWRLRSYFSA